MKQKLIDWALNQSPVFIVMAVVAYVQFEKQNELEKKVDNCQGQQIELLKTTVEKNTEAMKSFTEELRLLRMDK